MKTPITIVTGSWQSDKFYRKQLQKQNQQSPQNCANIQSADYTDLRRFWAVIFLRITKQAK
jgi:hypothetical protein